MPGRIIDGALIRRPVIFYNICYGVNAFADPSHHEAAYLFLQWAGGARIYTWLTANPAGYQDPHHIYSLNDPLVAGELQAAAAGDVQRDRAAHGAADHPQGRRCVPRLAVSEEIQKVLTKQSSPEDAAKSLQDRWDKITDDVGVDLQVEALKTFVAAFPTVIDTPSA